MVNRIRRKKADVSYSLATVHRLAADGHVHYAGRRIQLDIENLGYAPTDVYRVLQSLRAGDFAHSEQYKEGGFWLDVYKTTWLAPSGVADDLYIKLKVSKSGRPAVVVCSFHLKR